MAEAPEPALDSDRAALVRPLAVATCDLDAMIVAGRVPFPAPFPIGHECVAEVLEVGDGVDAPRPARWSASRSRSPAGSARAAGEGAPPTAREVPFMATYGFGPAVERWGGFLSDVVARPLRRPHARAAARGRRAGGVASASDNIADAWRAVAPALEREPGAPVLVVGGAARARSGSMPPRSRSRSAPSTVVYVDADEGRRARGRRARRRDDRGDAQSGSGRSRSRSTPAPTPTDSRSRCARRRPTASARACAIYFGEQPSLPLLEMYTKGITFVTGRANAREAMPHVLALAAAGSAAPGARHQPRSSPGSRRPTRSARGRLDEARVRALRRSASRIARARAARPS